ncbi:MULTISPECIES: YaaA family protein [unclassified Campylobacter]|uniref:YaaA family protein n=1 Tax=unclassified Campylobacter TaxID=2593542 RepID=UPI0012383800|nr:MULTISPECIES: peroxide stress protein YaaA [unclassified Campylobacter]KAA6226719.1 peroxide stress protein YaaA [Campylobacter sp. LR196d]KAA6228685.1 peroxide stress protein YaaA [Campylobacter sp. LR185c]KAA6229088.1 peroxide stress protein YaaA [Campylobacter sp. LR286c]KAA6230156.1 peroxide stress protein YaaA [Campylobacter sp. LR291e]KAA6233677.1 peroxide stress protein YaaA [Campylobacter sp. LR264d]
MKILFSPSEAKNYDCKGPFISKDSFIFKELFTYRMQALKAYEEVINSNDDTLLQGLFGLKNNFEKFKNDLKKANTTRAIELYNGVSYENLAFLSLDERAQNFLLKNVLIFSNLFGPVLASDALPFYKFKQGFKLPNFEIEKFYKNHFSKALNEYLKDDEILDLRASFYDKFYIPNKEFYVFKFLKNGKVVSHFAKAYRGLLLRHIALKGINSCKILLENLPSNLSLKDIDKKGLKTKFILQSS